MNNMNKSCSKTTGSLPQKILPSGWTILWRKALPLALQFRQMGETRPAGPRIRVPSLKRPPGLRRLLGAAAGSGLGATGTPAGKVMKDTAMVLIW